MKTQIIHTVWSESSLSAWRNFGSLVLHWAGSEVSDQPWHPFADRTCHFVGFAIRWLILGIITVFKDCCFVHRKVWVKTICTLKHFIIAVENSISVFMKEAWQINGKSSFWQPPGWATLTFACYIGWKCLFIIIIIVVVIIIFIIDGYRTFRTEICPGYHIKIQLFEKTEELWRFIY